jgi:D-beta-D-heptose 7-phosphate kinase/D-beta-D-heptose 1-phosphate adenosyltransferase
LDPLVLAGKRVLVVGDVMLDEYIYGSADRISPEAPVPVVTLERRVDSGGGAANTASNVAALGGLPYLVGVVGNDAYAERLRRAVEMRGIQLAGLVSDPDRPTTLKSRVIAHGQQVLRLDHESTASVSAEIEQCLIDAAAPMVESVDAVVVCDYAKGVVTRRVCQDVLSRCRSSHKPSVVDPKGTDFGKYAGARLITPNLKEAQLAVAHLHLPDDPYVWAAALLEELDGTAILITKGAAGMTLHQKSQATVEIAARARSVYDVTGAGDTVAATAAMALAGGLSLEQSVWLANVAAGIVVRKPGTATTSLHELAEAVKEAP